MATESKMIPVESEADIPAQHRDDPIGLFLRYHNLGKAFEGYTTAQLLIGMCMDSRKHMRIPDNFAYIIRSGGANLRHADFKVSYAIGVGGVRAIALVGHTNCGMCGLHRRREQFVNGLVENAGWERQRAEDHFNAFAPIFEIGNEIEFVKEEAGRLNQRYPKVPVVPMIYKIEDNRLYLVKE